MNNRRYLDKNNLLWWKPDKTIKNLYKQEFNVGDRLSELLVQRVVPYFGHEYKKASNPILAVGSILHFAKPMDTIWGTGINGKIPLSQLDFSDLDVRAVRGPKTRQILLDKGIACPEVYGDPGILTSTFFPILNKKVKCGVGYIPHMEEKINDIPGSVNLISPLLSLPEFIKEITSCEKVISSSLHGLIIAESYGIPAIHIRNSSGEADFKYQDYYQGTGRSEFYTCQSINEGLSANYEVYNLETCKKRLLKSFPIDLWEG